MTTRRCDAIGCAKLTQTGRFLCPAHWYLVPESVRLTINARYRAGRRDLTFLNDVQYLQACVVAIETIARSEGPVVEPTSYHRLLQIALRKAAS